MNKSACLVSCLWLLAGCGMVSGNSMSARAGAPFSLGAVNSALWYQDNHFDPELGEGKAHLLLIDEQMDCGDFADELNGLVDYQYRVQWWAEGISAEFYWFNGVERNDGWEGEYYAGVLTHNLDEGAQGPDDADRLFTSDVFSDAAVYYGDHWYGVAEIGHHGDDQVEGQIETETYKASFQAENCGIVPEPGGSG